MLNFLCFVSLIPLTLTFQPFPDVIALEEVNQVHSNFHKILKTSDHCVILRHDVLFNLNPRNHSAEMARLQREIYQKYIDLVHHNLPDVFIESLLDLYCKAKLETLRTRNSMKPPSHLKGNSTWDFTNDVPENNDYRVAKFNEKQLYRQYQNARDVRIYQMRKLRMSEQKSSLVDNESLKHLYRTSAFIIMLSLALNIQNVLRMYYEEEEDEEEEDEDEAHDMRVELAQIALLSSSLFCIFMALYELQ